MNCCCVFLQDLLIMTVFSVTLTYIVYIHKPPHAFYITNTVQQNLVDSIYADGTTVEDVCRSVALIVRYPVGVRGTFFIFPLFRRLEGKKSALFCQTFIDANQHANNANKNCQQL